MLAFFFSMVREVTRVTACEFTTKKVELWKMSDVGAAKLFVS